jgi:hypothetical protein
MKLRVIRTTDDKYIGFTFEHAESFALPDGIIFIPVKIQHIGGGLVQYSNVHYVILAKEIN